jgi:hypothetical protein
MELIPPPILEVRDEEQLAAEAVGRVSGPYTLDILDFQIERLQRQRALIVAEVFDQPVCPELRNANPSAPHTALIEALAWVIGQLGRKINSLPRQNEVEFANLFRIGLREATPAQTVLEFAVAPPPGVDVLIPSGSQVSTADGLFVYETIEELVIPFGEESGQVEARRIVAGETTLAPNVLIKMADPVAWVDSVTNPQAVNSGSNDEQVEEALERARNYQQRSERLVSTRDIETALLEEALLGNGIVRAFPFVRGGDFLNQRVGHTTVIVMSKTGDPVDANTRIAINAILEQLVGNQFIYVLDPIYVNFDVVANVRLSTNAVQGATLAAIQTRLRAFYAASRANFGRQILRSEVIAEIEATPGVDRIVAQTNGAILASPTEDVKLDPWQLSKLVNVTLTVV